MARPRNTIKEVRAAKDFLRQRNLLSTFNRFKKIRSLKKKSFTVEQDDISHRLVALKRGNRIIVLDAFSLRQLATTKRFNLNTIQRAFEGREVRTRKFGSKTFQAVKNKVSLSEVTRIPLVNVVEIQRRTALRKKVGRIYMSVTFTSEKGDVQTTEGGSRQPRLLSDIGERDKAYEEALFGAKSKLAFYDVKDFIINWIHFSYFIEKKKPQPIFQFEKSLKAV